MKKTSMKKLHFEKKASYAHEKAIEVLVSWIKLRPNIFGIHDLFAVNKEIQFFDSNDLILFVPDIVVYSKTNITHIFEVEFTHGLDADKLNKMMNFFWLNRIFAKVYEVKAVDILSCTEPITDMKQIKFFEMI